MEYFICVVLVGGLVWFLGRHSGDKETHSTPSSSTNKTTRNSRGEYVPAIPMPTKFLNKGKVDFPDKQVVLDVETTGLELDDRIVEICMVERTRGVVTNTLSIRVNPERTISESARRVHGITNDMVKDAPKFSEIAEQVVEMLNEAEVIGHNVSFDLGMVERELELLGIDMPEHQSCCTLQACRAIWRGQKNNLDAACDRLGIDRSARVKHGAEIDVYLTMELHDRLFGVKPFFMPSVASTALRRISFGYTNAKKESAIREVEVRKLNAQSISTFDVEKQGTRSFRYDKIANQQIVLCDTGEIVSVEDYRALFANRFG